MRLLNSLCGSDGDEDTEPRCRCDPAVRSPSGYEPDRPDILAVDAERCSNGGDLVQSPACRATVIDALGDRDVDAVHVTSGGRTRIYDPGAVELLVAAARFAVRVAVHDESLAQRARTDPLAAAHTARGRAGPVSDLAARTGLDAGAERVDDYDDALGSTVEPTVSNARVDPRPPDGATLCGQRTLDTGASVRRYRTDEGDYYLLDPLGARLDAASLSALAEAYSRLSAGEAMGAGAVSRAVRTAVEGADDEVATAAVERVLRKHTAGHGVLEDLFADPEISEVVVTAPVVDTPVRVVTDGDRVRTNVHLTRAGVAALSSRFRRESGRAFSRAAPTLDATTDARNGQIRVAGITDPASEGTGFVFRSGDRDTWTLPALVANGTLPVAAAALCSVAVDRAAAGLIAGPRGAGKTTFLGALLWELSPSVRSIVVEDTPELPATALRDAGRDVQTIRIETTDGPSLSPTEALRTALRLGEGALIVGEVRGEEAATLYEAMRVGAASSTVLGTIHGDGADAVYERVVTDLGVQASSFAATDFLVTLSDGGNRGVATIEEVRHNGDGVSFRSLYEPDDDGDAVATGVVDRGNSHLVASLARPEESYGDVRDAIRQRAACLTELVETERTAPNEVDTVRRNRETR